MIVLSQNTQIPLDKNQFTIFNATNLSNLREMETDRPDVTESSYTVDAGHFQYEGDLLRMTLTEENGIRNQKIVFNNGTYKIGITNTFDIHFAFENYILNYQSEYNNRYVIRTQGLGDAIFRCKKNIIGNDSGEISIAILLNIKVPTTSFYKNINIEGGVIFPFTLNYINDWAIGGEVEFQLLKKSGEPAYKSFYLQSLVVEHELTKKIAFFLETHYIYSNDLNRFENYINGGLIFIFNKNVHLDCGFNYGLQDYAYKSYFVGMSYRK